MKHTEQRWSQWGKVEGKERGKHRSPATSATLLFRSSWSLFRIPNWSENREMADSVWTLLPSSPLGTEAKGVPGTTDIFRFAVGMQINPCLFWHVYPTAMRGLQGEWEHPILLAPPVKGGHYEAHWFCFQLVLRQAIASWGWDTLLCVGSWSPQVIF